MSFVIAPCSICGAERSRHEAVVGETCAALDCRAAAEPVVDVARIEARQAAADAALGVKDRAAAKRAMPVPFLDRPVGMFSPERSKEFRATLRTAFRDVVLAALAGQPFRVLEEEDGRAAPEGLDASCIACRGWCCRQGEGHAFLKPQYLATVIARHGSERPAHLYRRLVRQMPREGVELSCPYHGAEGCALVRADRSPICNAFECEDRIGMRRALSEGSGAVVAMALDDLKVRARVASDALGR